MPKENINPEEGQVQPSPEATDEITLDKIKTMTPEEQLSFYNNSREAIKAATQRNMETAEREKLWKEERNYLLNDRQRLDTEIQQYRDQLTQYGQLSQQAGQQTQPSPRRYDELTPEQAYEQLYNEQKTTQAKLDEIEKKYRDSLEEVRGEVIKTQRSIKYEKFLEREIFPNYKYVTQDKLDDWFTAHPTVPAEPKTVHMAAKEIHDQEDAVFEAEVQARLKAKAEKDEQAELAANAAPLAAVPGETDFIDMTPAQQAAQIEKDIKKLQGQ